MRRRHLESVSAAPYERCQSIVRIQPQLSGKGVLGHSPKRVLVWGPRRDARPAGERRSGGALEGCLSHRDSNPIWSAARDDAYAQKERPGGEPYRLSPCGDSATPLGDHKLAPPGRHTDYAFVKGTATPKATTNLAPAAAVLIMPCKRPRPAVRRPQFRHK